MAQRDNSDLQAAVESDLRDRGVRLDEPPVSTSATRDALLRLVESIQHATITPAPSRIEPVADGAFVDPIADVVDEILAPAKSHAVFRAPVGVSLPIFDAAYRNFRVAIPPPWTLRVDDEDSYAAWREDCRAPYVAALAERVAALENALAERVQDDHAGRLAELERAFDKHVEEHDLTVLGEEVAKATSLAKAGGDTVPLSLDPNLAPGVDCWQDGDEVVCSFCYRAADGSGYVLTAGTPYAEHLDAAVRHVVDAGVDPLEIAPVFHRVVQALAASALLPRIMSVAPDAVALARGEAPFTCRVTASGDPALAAAMSLVQRAKGKDKVARQEVDTLRAGGGRALLDEADRQIAAAKKARAR